MYLFLHLLYSATIQQQFQERTRYMLNITYNDVDFSLQIYTVDTGNITLEREISLNNSAPFEVPESVSFTNLYEIPITACGSSAFANSNITKITFPSSILSYGSQTFRDANISHIDMSQSQITRFPDTFFYRATNVSTIDLPPNIEYISYGCFFQCSKLKTLSLPPNIQLSRNGQCFAYCSLLESIDLSEANVTYIPEYCFFNCSSLMEIRFPDSWNYTGAFPFYGVPIPDFAVYPPFLSSALMKGTLVTSYDFSSYNDNTISNHF